MDWTGGVGPRVARPGDTGFGGLAKYGTAVGESSLQCDAARDLGGTPRGLFCWRGAPPPVRGRSGRPETGGAAGAETRSKSYGNLAKCGESYGNPTGIKAKGPVGFGGPESGLARGRGVGGIFGRVLLCGERRPFGGGRGGGGDAAGAGLHVGGVFLGRRRVRSAYDKKDRQAWLSWIWLSAESYGKPRGFFAPP